MTPIPDLLEREARRIEPRADALGQTLDRVARRERRRRVATVAAVLVPLALAALVASRLAERSGPVPIDDPVVTTPRNGPIMVDIGQTFGLIDPATRALVSSYGFPYGLEVDGYPSWSPDGQQLAYGRDRLVVASADGSERDLGPCGLTCYPTWSGDGRSIVYWAPDGLRQVDPSTGESVPTWGFPSPDGSRAYRFSDRGVEVRDVGDSDPATVVIPRDGELFRMQSRLLWSPDGTELAWMSRLPGCEDVVCPRELVIVSADGSREPRVIFETGPVACVRFFCDLGWSPDGSRFVLATPRAAGRRGGVYTIARDGSDLRRVAPASDGPVAWRPEV